MKNTEAALLWIVSILQKHDIPFQIGGGFAARVYGSQREIADIDIAIPEKKFEILLPDIKEYLIAGPEHYIDKEWDLQLMTVSYGGQEIEFAGAYEKKFFDREKQEWVMFPSDFSSSEYREVYGIKVPLMEKQKLIKYKKMLAREVDLEDVRGLEIQK